MFRLIVMTVLAVGCATAEVSVPKDATEIESRCLQAHGLGWQDIYIQEDTVRYR